MREPEHGSLRCSRRVVDFAIWRSLGMSIRDGMATALDHYLKSGMSRRERMGTTVAVGGVAALGPLGASAAGIGHGPAVLAPAQDEDWAEAPVKFVWVDTAEPTSIDPALVQDTSSFSFTRNVYEPLIEIDPAQ